MGSSSPTVPMWPGAPRASPSRPWTAIRLPSSMRRRGSTSMTVRGVTPIGDGDEQTQQNEERPSHPTPARARSLTLDTHDIKTQAHTIQADVRVRPGELFEIYLRRGMRVRLIEARHGIWTRTFHIWLSQASHQMCQRIRFAPARRPGNTPAGSSVPINEIASEREPSPRSRTRAPQGHICEARPVEVPASLERRHAMPAPHQTRTHDKPLAATASAVDQASWSRPLRSEHPRSGLRPRARCRAFLRSAPLAPQREDARNVPWGAR
jgi:hypothetical protein